MAKLIVQHEQDPGIAIVLEYVPSGTPGRALGYHGKCTQCGWPLHRWERDTAILSAFSHIEKHESAL